jgi:hypothetical protein
MEPLLAPCFSPLASHRVRERISGMPYDPLGREWSRTQALRHKAHMALELWQGSRRVGVEHGISMAEVFRRYRDIRRATLASPREFFRYRLWDTTRPRSERATFLTWARRRPLEASLNPKHLAEYANSKLKSADALAANGLPVPRQLGVWQPKPGDANGIASLKDMIQGQVDGLVMKPEHGVSGHGVMVFTAYQDGRLRQASGKWWSLTELAAELAKGTDAVVVQERLTAHPEIAVLAGTTFAASLRLVTCLRDDGRVLVLPATLKLPSAVTGIDNFGSGNVAIAVDEAGVMGGAAHGLDGPPIDRHPVTGLEFAGRVVPDFAAAVDVVCRGQRAYPLLRAIGWDIAMTPSGPCILEANVWWGVDVVQQPGLRGLLRGEFLEFLEEVGAEKLKS